jgi:hypothetical protein
MLEEAYRRGLSWLFAEASMFYICLIVSASILVTSNVWVARSPRGKLGGVCWLAGVATVFSLGFLCVAFPVLALNFLSLLIVALICNWTRAPARVFLGLSLLVTVSSYGLVSASAIYEILENTALRMKNTPRRGQRLVPRKKLDLGDGLSSRKESLSQAPCGLTT